MEGTVAPVGPRKPRGIAYEKWWLIAGLVWILTVGFWKEPCVGSICRLFFGIGGPARG